MNLSFPKVLMLIMGSVLIALGVFIVIQRLEERYYEGVAILPKEKAQELALEYGKGDFSMLPEDTEGNVELTYSFRAKEIVGEVYGLPPNPLTGLGIVVGVLPGIILATIGVMIPLALSTFIGGGESGNEPG